MKYIIIQIDTKSNNNNNNNNKNNNNNNSSNNNKNEYRSIRRSRLQSSMIN